MYHTDLSEIKRLLFFLPTFKSARSSLHSSALAFSVVSTSSIG
jgi:hypothetical protein